jgi:hypothetical protein
MQTGIYNVISFFISGFLSAINKHQLGEWLIAVNRTKKINIGLISIASNSRENNTYFKHINATRRIKLYTPVALSLWSTNVFCAAHVHFCNIMSSCMMNR